MSTRKKALFQAGARSLRKLTEWEVDVYVCPLCLTAHDASALEKGQLTLEHVPPASIGGEGIVLTCHTCNSKAGHTIEAELHKYHEVLNFVKALVGRGDFSGRIQLEMSGTTTNVDAMFEDGKLNMELPADLNNPSFLQEQTKQLDRMVDDGTWDGYRFRVTPVTKFNLRLANLSYLKTAYLAAFASLGYTYIRDTRLNPVRKQIAQPNEKIISSYMVGLPSHHESTQKMIAIEEPFKALVVQLGRKLIFLPPIDPSESFYDNLPGFLRRGATEGTLSGSTWPFPTKLELQLDLNTPTN